MQARSLATTLLSLFLMSGPLGARSMAIHAAFDKHQAHTLFSDRFSASTRCDFAIPIREAGLGVYVAHVDDRVHLFCHSDECIYQCFWDDTDVATTSLQKMHVLRGLKTWHDATNATEELSLCTVECEDMWAWDNM